MADKYSGRGVKGGRNGSRSRVASSIKRENNDDVQTSKAKKSMEGSMASEIMEKVKLLARRKHQKIIGEIEERVMD